MKTDSSLWRSCLQQQKTNVEAEAQINMNSMANNMRLAEERANNEFRQHSAAWQAEASNTVNFARSEIEASRFRAEIEEREKHEAAIRLQEAEAEKRNLEAKLHQEQLRANQRELESQNE